ncbi:site-specific DNA-methyltransferase [Vibrio parahaemolyticus]
MDHLPDIKPRTIVSTFNRDEYLNTEDKFNIDKVSLLVGMSNTFIKKVCGNKKLLSSQDVLSLLDQDSYKETIVPRSKVLSHLISTIKEERELSSELPRDEISLFNNHAIDQIRKLPTNSVQCVVTSTPYWGLRIYKDSYTALWADGEKCPYGHEQTPEGFIRHTTEVLASLYDVLAEDGSIWWNVMDSFNTRTQIRSNASEALQAMQGKDKRSWSEHSCRRHSAGHSYLKDGEQCMIPSQIAERASRLGYYVKSVITWAKTSSLPEPQNSRVSRNLEYIIHLTKQRTPRFNKHIYLDYPAELGGKNNGNETNKLSDVWTLPTSSGRDGHGAQFPLALPARCIALSTSKGDLVLDPFVGSGNSGVAAKKLGRRFIGIDVSDEYLALAKERVSDTSELLTQIERCK